MFVKIKRKDAIHYQTVHQLQNATPAATRKAVLFVILSQICRLEGDFKLSLVQISERHKAEVPSTELSGVNVVMIEKHMPH